MVDENPRFGVLLLLLLTLACAAGFALAVERQFAERLDAVSAPSPPRDAAGRRLYILMIDSLTPEDGTRMPRFQALGEAGFQVILQPCFDNFTTACVREMLTGRRSFSLFSALENFDVTRPGVGENLISDARDAGLKTALVSHGDLKSWTSLVDTDRRLDEDEGEDQREATIGLGIAAEHDLVFHHWIWHDVASHHYAKKKKGKKYTRSLQRTNALIADIADGLPPDMDLIVTGDHGHADDGRHIQGMDIPTVLVARSPNLTPMAVEGPTPIASVRYVAGAILGIGNQRTWVEEGWRGWAAPVIGEALRGVGAGREGAEASARFPTGPVIAALLVALVAAGALGWRAGAVVLTWAAITGFLYPDWLEFSINQGYRKPFMQLAWGFPLVGAALGWRRERAAGAWWGAAAGGLALGLMLAPGLYFISILRNLAAMAGPALLIGGLFVLLGAAELWRGGDRRRALAVTAGGAAAVTLFLMSTDFNSNYFAIRRLPLLWIFEDHSALRLPVSALLGAAVHRLLDRDLRWVWLGPAAVLLGDVLPGGVMAAAFVALSIALAAPRGPWRVRAVSALALLITGYTLSVGRQLGLLWMVLGAGLGLELVQQAAARAGGEAGARAGRWAAAALLATAGLMAMAWTTGLKLSGVDFTFAVDWLPGRLHKELWWVVLGAAVLNAVLPVLLLFELAHARLGALGLAAAELAARFSALRVAATLVFTATWIVAVGDRAASARLHSFLQDGLVWLLIGLTLTACLVSARRSLRERSPRPAPPPASSAGTPPPRSAPAPASSPPAA